MCLQWLLRFVARYNGARIRVTYSRDNWRNWWIMVPRHTGYFEAMFRFASKQLYHTARARAKIMLRPSSNSPSEQGFRTFAI